VFPLLLFFAHSLKPYTRRPPLDAGGNQGRKITDNSYAAMADRESDWLIKYSLFASLFRGLKSLTFNPAQPLSHTVPFPH